MRPHLHKYKFECVCTNWHKHKLIGYTDKMLGIGAFHIHQFSGISSYYDHTHSYSGITGLPIKTANGHMHKIQGVLQICNAHEHSFCSYTGEDVEHNGKTGIKIVQA